MIVLVVAMEFTMGYSVNQSQQPAARPVPGLGL
jgi:hypothetical protein